MSLHDPNKYLSIPPLPKGGSGFITPSLEVNKKSGLASSKIKTQSFVISEIYKD